MTGASTTKTKPTEPADIGNRYHLFVRFARWFVGLVLVATGLGKALDVKGFAEVLSAYDLLPNLGNVLMAHTLPFIELASGLCLLVCMWLRSAAWVAVGLHLAWLGAALITLWRGIALDNCGCFGVFLARPLTGQTVVEDALLLAMSLLILRDSRRRTMEVASIDYKI